MSTVEKFQEFLRNYEGEPDYELEVVTFDGKKALVAHFTYNEDTRVLRIHCEKTTGSI